MRPVTMTISTPEAAAAWVKLNTPDLCKKFDTVNVIAYDPKGGSITIKLTKKEDNETVEEPSNYENVDSPLSRVFEE